MLRDYEITHSLPSKLNPQDLCEQPTPQDTLDETKDLEFQLHKNVSIQLGILIKAYGLIGRLDMAFGTFFKHKSDTSNNDIIFGCLIDACVNNGYIDRAEETFNKIQNGGWMGIQGNTIIYTTMIKAYS